MLIDFHSHILPAVDDGSRSVDESVKMLEVMAENGVDVVVASPHFYPDEISVSDFLKRRDNAYAKLEASLNGNYPQILLGAEVLYSPRLVRDKDFHKLCIGKTDYVLLEMPYTRLTDAIIDGVEELYNRTGKNIIVAHIERYLKFTSYDDLAKLMSLDLLGQLNASSFIKRKTRKYCFKLIKDGYAHLLGSDFHRLDREVAPVEKAYEIVAAKISSETADKIMFNSRQVLKNTLPETLLV